MKKIFLALCAFALLACSTNEKRAPALSAPFPANSQNLFSSYDVMQIQLSAPLTKLFAAKKLRFDQIKKVHVSGVMYYLDSSNHWQQLPVDIRLKGFSTLRYCQFPKMELAFHPQDTAGTPFADLKSVDLNTHCAEPDDKSVDAYFLSGYYNHREALIYQMMDILGMPSLRARPVAIQYQNTQPSSTVKIKSTQTYEAFFVEDMGAFKKRTNTKEIKASNDLLKGLALSENPQKAPMYAFKSLDESSQMDREDASRIALFECMIGNWDWTLKTAANEKVERNIELWNIKVVETQNGKWIPIPQDFNLSGMAFGRPIQFHLEQKVFEAVDKNAREKIKKQFKNKKDQLYQLVSEFGASDTEGAQNMKGMLDNFFNQLPNL